MNIEISKMQRRSKDRICYLCLIIIATLCGVLYARSTGMLHPENYSYDGTIFMHMGQAIKSGYVPYRDIYEIKGPMLWLIEFIGQLISDGRAGMYLLQILNLNAIAIVTYKAARYYLSELQAVMSVPISIAFIIGTCRLEHTVEEFTYLYSITAVCITLKNMRSVKGFWNKRDFFMYGLLAMAAILIRVMDYVVVGACIIYAGIMTYRKYGLKKLFINYGYVLMGAVLLLLPFVIYIAANDAIYDWFDATVFFSMRYAGFNKTPIRLRLLAILLVPVSMSAYSIIKGNKGLPVLAFAMSFMCLMLYLVVGTTYNYYMTMAVPCIFISVIQFIVEIKKNKLIVNMLFCVLFFCSNFTWMYSFASATKYIFASDSTNYSLVFAENIRDIIGSEDTDSVYTYYTDPAIPFVNEYFSRSKYYSAQVQWSQDEQKRNEIYYDFIDGNNTWVVIDGYGMEYGDSRLIERLASDYTQLYQYNEIYLYKRK